MKNIKQRIVYLILGAALLLFALFMLAVNVIIPAHFVREAKKALISEARYQNRTIPYTDSGTIPNSDWDNGEEALPYAQHCLSGAGGWLPAKRMETGNLPIGEGVAGLLQQSEHRAGSVLFL